MPTRNANLPLALVWLLALPALWWSLTAAPALRVDVGAWGDHTALTGINGVEESSTENYRWTMERAELALPNLSAGYRLLRWLFRTRPAPVPVTTNPM